MCSRSVGNRYVVEKQLSNASDVTFCQCTLILHLPDKISLWYAHIIEWTQKTASACCIPMKVTLKLYICMWVCMFVCMDVCVYVQMEYVWRMSILYNTYAAQLPAAFSFYQQIIVPIIHCTTPVETAHRQAKAGFWNPDSSHIHCTWSSPADLHLSQQHPRSKCSKLRLFPRMFHCPPCLRSQLTAILTLSWGWGLFQDASGTLPIIYRQGRARGSWGGGGGGMEEG